MSTRTFTVVYTEEQALDPLIDPDAIVATAADIEGVILTYVRQADPNTVTFSAEVDDSDADQAFDNLVHRLPRHDLNVVDVT